MVFISMQKDTPLPTHNSNAPPLSHAQGPHTEGNRELCNMEYTLSIITSNKKIKHQKHTRTSIITSPLCGR